MVADSITDSHQLLHGSLTSSDFFKKPKANRSVDEDDESGLSAGGSSSPTSVIKNEDSGSVDNDDCFCCSKQVTEEEAFVDAHDGSSDEDYRDALSMSNEEDPSQSDENKDDDYSDALSMMFKDDDQKKEDDDCPLCAEKMDETDLQFELCSCGYKICLFCYKNLKEDTGLCPACRKKYKNQQTSSNIGEVSFQQQRGGDPVPLSSAFHGLDDCSD
ncbi:RING/U-box superfamily protein [Raphanus sativus]|uniref:Uncharacterized protein LOC108841300 n=1 Tax=Raphanus sativus TaxID=3726 RepID=A0A6J0MDJ3_RAPSA|nr:uncharacterized protein LOC108841300 [Raphanus sativus]KAJ4909306.1 RING/U-box superfamily protein [Raphanus sativus]